MSHSQLSGWPEPMSQIHSPRSEPEKVLKSWNKSKYLQAIEEVYGLRV